MRIDQWAGLASAMAIQACGGLTYTYAVYSEHLKEVLQFTQVQVDEIGAAKDFGQSLGILGGLLFNLYPPFVTVSIGAVLHFFGYMIVLMTLSRKMSPPFWLLCTAIGIGVGGDSWMDLACIGTNLRNFQEHRGTVLGILKAEVGLSGAIFVTIYKAFFKPNVDRYVLLVAVGPTIIGLALALMIRPYSSEGFGESNRANTQWRFQLTYGTIISLAVYLLVIILTEAFLEDELTKPVLIAFAIVMITIMGISFAMPVLHSPVAMLKRRMTGERASMSSAQERGFDILVDESNIEISGGNVMLHRIHKSCTVEHEEQAPLKGEFETRSKVGVDANLGEDTCVKNIFESPFEPPDMTVRKAIQTANFWILAFIAMMGPGCGLAVINNLSQMGRAMDMDGVESLVGLFSIWSCFGRLIAGYGSDSLLRKGWPRPLSLLAAHFTMMFGCLLLATGSVPILALGSACVGLAYGAFWSLIPCIVSEVFGLRQFPTIYKAIVSIVPFGAYLLSAQVVGFLYDREVLNYHSHFPNRQWSTKDINTCYGRRCFGYSLVFLASISVMGVAVASVLAWCTKNVYVRSRTTPLETAQ
ncbi:protein NUCLEAR FUSION DEFECTIVE 4 isoform X1 [Physcomitrium patens]|uniref:Uncharacterized protein n=2 Tax=Physcomitrium patens TaxID=3218 RepID=A0A2K1JBL1_PHYPA|nr:protein NUCLEAR FUSION DEFECTIVE 4-like isoform X1 [Physcomitrium patens]XP_024396429.1 protein NUCLEAR FUSION DEFECTIVE 4-like isoform X1 [Physcomitrium patens]XP_024396430.1 protein NUCLEAR FUSION DEFECTIVE 4-like isoform X1 [Physcomitrium patens]PNR38926.1 hypothetical protein PHYPA_019204 [Physcomitrium patens]|eukprot:XP_024396427.1 protein NUCLEAR FUSION DEFECTIVE 4-like isoform X1 [Physcomitrella patens]